MESPWLESESPSSLSLELESSEALALLEKQPDRFDLIVTDYAMPVVSGMEVIRLARNIRAGWPAVMITGHADAEMVADWPADVPVLRKPFPPAALIETVEKVFAANKG
jgi:CheY-like chemotaxis protein